jgi:riboflavin kinase/FMN adenylyltransferase
LDIYGENVQLFFLEKVRDEKKFESLEALKLQISKDVMLISAN